MARLQTNFSGERRSAHFGLQLTPSERAELERRAHTRGMLLAEFVRACCFVTEAPEAHTSRRRTRDATALALVGELGRVGNNLNQLAKHANQTGQIAEEVALNEAIADLKAALGRIV